MRRAGADDKPLRMVKTVLHELVKLRGAAIKGHLSLVPIDMRPQPIILAYIDLNLEVNSQSFSFLSRILCNCAEAMVCHRAHPDDLLHCLSRW